MADVSAAGMAPAPTSRPGLIARFFRALEARRVYRATRNELNSLTDRELNDIGIGRGDIERIAREAHTA